LKQSAFSYSREKLDAGQVVGEDVFGGVLTVKIFTRQFVRETRVDLQVLHVFRNCNRWDVFLHSFAAIGRIIAQKNKFVFGGMLYVPRTRFAYATVIIVVNQLSFILLQISPPTRTIFRLCHKKKNYSTCGGH
jgi:hypothetical protein